MLDSITLETPTAQKGQGPVATVIWLHGLGADGNDFAPIVPQLKLDDLAIRFVFPHAPTMPVTINNGYVMRAWYDVVSTDLLSKQDLAGTKASQNAIEELILREIAQGIDANHIILMGFSQGGVMALYTGLRFTQTLGGIAALSSYLPFAESTKSEASKFNQGVPIFMAHGQFDPIIPVVAGKSSKEMLEQLGYSVIWHEYAMEHSVHPDEISAIGSWIRKRVGTAK